MSFLIKKPVIKKKKYLEMIGKIPVYGQGRPISSLLITFTPSEERTETKIKSKRGGLKTGCAEAIRSGIRLWFIRQEMLDSKYLIIQKRMAGKGTFLFNI